MAVIESSRSPTTLDKSGARNDGMGLISGGGDGDGEKLGAQVVVLVVITMVVLILGLALMARAMPIAQIFYGMRFLV